MRAWRSPYRVSLSSEPSRRLSCHAMPCHALLGFYIVTQTNCIDEMGGWDEWIGSIANGSPASDLAVIIYQPRGVVAFRGSSKVMTVTLHKHLGCDAISFLWWTALGSTRWLIHLCLLFPRLWLCSVRMSWPLVVRTTRSTSMSWQGTHSPLNKQSRAPVGW